VRRHLTPSYSCTGRPSTNPKLLVRMLLVGYRYGIRSERQLCEEVELNLAYRWLCRLGLDCEEQDHSTLSKNRHGRFRDSDLLRKLFETVVNSLALLATKCWQRNLALKPPSPLAWRYWRSHRGLRSHDEA